MNGPKEIYEVLDDLDIKYEYYEHPPAPTIDEARKYWRNIEATHCKNIFFRNHKGNRHYLVILDSGQQLDIHDMEKRLKQGKLSFASPRRLKKYLGLEQGSVSPFGLINDNENHVHLFIDRNLQKAHTISFHPNVNTASLVIYYKDFIRFLDWSGNSYEFLKLYE
ncbi:MAG: prolyl-tRNA synthetase associated domain-containing protein [Bacteroidetes bacterium]|nr:prolyl-tRNA synthetase associated domain-containing protein [Bacteroidota bacterium]